MVRKIAAVGDSHALCCFKGHSLIADAAAQTGVNPLDGKTAYKLADHHELLLEVIAPLKDRQLIFSFGEVDVRIHIKYQHRRRQVPTGKLIDNTARRYLGYVHRLRRQGYAIHVFNVVPTGEYAGRRFEGWKKKLRYPFTTRYAERRRFTLQLNARYRVLCRALDIPFIDVYHRLVDSRGRRRSELVHDFSHLNGATADIVLAHHLPFRQSSGCREAIPPAGGSRFRG